MEGVDHRLVDPIIADVSLSTCLQGCKVAVAVEVIYVVARGDAVADIAEIHGYNAVHPGALAVVVVHFVRRLEMIVQVKEVGELHAADGAEVHVPRALTVADTLMVFLTAHVDLKLGGTGAENITCNTMVMTVGNAGSGSSGRETRHSCE